MDNLFEFPILSSIIFLPFIGSLILLMIQQENQAAIRRVAFGISVGTFFLSLPLLFGFDVGNANMQFEERADWIPTLGVTYAMGIDGLSLLLTLLTTLITPIAIISSFSAIKEKTKAYYACILFLETSMLGVFMAMDLFLFYIFWEIMLVPMYFLIGIWGGGRRLYSAIKFFLFTLFGSLFMLLGILGVYFLNHNPDYGTGTFTFSILDLYKINLPLSLQLWLFFGFFLGFAIKVPMFPFHTWLPDAHTDAPTAGSVILAGVLLKMGTYGFVRFCLPLFPDASHAFVPMMVVLSLIGIVYGAFLALAQKDMKRLVAYSSVSHLGFVMLGMFALNQHGITGSILQMINHGISTGALFLLVGMLYERRHTRQIADFGGLASPMPILTTFFAITMFSSMGLPGLNGFIGEFLILVGAFQYNKIYAGIAVIGVILGAAYMLWLFQRIILGPTDKQENKVLQDLNAREILYMAPLLILMFWIGLYPKPFIEIITPVTNNVIQMVNRGADQKQAERSAGRSDGHAEATVPVGGGKNTAHIPDESDPQIPQTDLARLE